jgi:hypothetical protein
MNSTCLESRPSDLLLSWLSARGKVSKPTLDHACLTIAERFNERDPKGRSPTPWSVAPLRRIGHVEEVAGGLGVVPPTLCWTARPGWAILIGARDDFLREKLLRRLGQSFLISQPHAPWPATWGVTGDRETTSAPAAELGISVVDEPGMRLLASLPTLKEAIVAWPETDRPSMSFEWEIADDPVGGRWHRKDATFVTDGLIRCADRRPRRWKIERLGKSRPADSPERRAVAWWAELARQARPRIAYDQRTGQLVLPASYLPPPVMVERPLIWASGEPPRGDRIQGWTYTAIEPERAMEIARVLGLGLERAL